MAKQLILLNTLLIPFHAGVVFAMAMSMAQAQTNGEIIDNLYWIVPVNLVFASLPNLLAVLIYLLQKKKTRLMKAFLLAEVYVIFLQLLLHGALLGFSIYGPNL